MDAPEITDETNIINAWHFVGATLRDGRPVPPDGTVLIHRGPVVPCESGLHASVKILDALHYAPGDTLCRVEVSGTIVEREDKLVASRRRILWRIDTGLLLREFARQCALSVAHLWEMPDVVRRYLETGDETLQAAAYYTALAAARDAAYYAALAAAEAGAEAGARDAAYYAAEADAWAAAEVLLLSLVEAERRRLAASAESV